MLKRKPATLSLVLILTFSALSTSVKADNADVWKRWLILLRQSCPRNHVDWTCDSCWTQLTGAFEDTLGTSDRRRFHAFSTFAIAKKSRSASHARWGRLCMRICAQNFCDASLNSAAAPSNAKNRASALSSQTTRRELIISGRSFEHSDTLLRATRF